MASTPASSPINTLQAKDKAPSTLAVLTVLAALGVFWLVVIIVIGIGLAAVIQWLMAN